jgi:hypothetical protein
MLSQFARLSTVADGRYATPEELQFLKDYFRSFNRRVSAYKKIQAAETEIIRKAQQRIQAIDPNLLGGGSQEVMAKWRLDTIRVLRYTTAALISNDIERFRNDFVVWFHSVLKALEVDYSAEITYQVILDIIKQYLTAEEAAIFIPIWELNRLKNP